MNRDPRNVLAIVFVLAGLAPILLWLIAWAQRSLTPAHLVQAAIIVGMLAVVWRIRRAWEKHHRGGRKESA